MDLSFRAQILSDLSYFSQLSPIMVGYYVNQLR